MRSGIVNRASVPTGVNLTPDIRFWNLYNGAIYLPEENAVELPTFGSSLISPIYRVDKPKYITWSEELWFPAEVESPSRLLSMAYYDAKQVNIGSNGNLSRPDTQTEVWTPFSYQLYDTGVNNLENSVWGNHTYSVSEVYGHPGMKIRLAQVSVQR